MSTVKHTPGPWIFDGANGKVIIGKHSINIPCKQNTNSAEYHDDCFANAKLIAAAPELLEALHELGIDEGKGWDFFAEYKDRRYGIPAKTRNKIIAAIKKAIE